MIGWYLRLFKNTCEMGVNYTPLIHCIWWKWLGTSCQLNINTFLIAALFFWGNFKHENFAKPLSRMAIVRSDVCNHNKTWPANMAEDDTQNVWGGMLDMNKAVSTWKPCCISIFILFKRFIWCSLLLAAKLIEDFLESLIYLVQGTSTNYL